MSDVDYRGKVRTRAGVLAPETSWAAAGKQTRMKVDLVKSSILALLAIHGPTIDEELVDLYAAHQFMHPRLPMVTDQSIRTRRADLVHQGLVVDSGLRGRTRLGNSAVRWDVAE
jgi:hypothetical protein